MHKRYPPPNPSRESGYTLLESIMAMVVVSVLMVAVAPVLGFAFASRVQAKRVELASKAANSYVNAVRSGKFDDKEDYPDYPELKSMPKDSFPDASVGGPTATGSWDDDDCLAGQLCQDDSLYCVDNDGDGACTTDSQTDMIVQGIANNQCSTDLKDGYQLSVRVYRADAFAEAGQLESDSKQSATGLGNPKAPLASVKTEIAPADLSFNDLDDRIRGCPPP